MLPSLALLASSFLAILLLLEVGTRLLVPAAAWRFREAAADWKGDARIGWVNKPNLDLTARVRESSVRFRTNPDGLIPHDARRESVPGRLRIMVFGDSMALGRWIPQNAIYTARLGAELRSRGIDAEVLNAGVEGYSTDQALLLMERWIPIYQPDVVVYGATLNDFGGNSSREAYSQSKPMFVLEETGLRLLPAGDVERLNTRARSWKSSVQYSAFYRMVQPRIRALRARWGDWRQRNLLGLMHSVYVAPRTLDDFDWDLFVALLKRMQRSAESAHATFFFLLHPTVAETWDPYIDSMCRQLRVVRSAYDRHVVERRMAAVAARAQVDFLPTIDYFAERQERGPFHLLPDDGHLSAAGHGLLAELLAEHLLSSAPGKKGP